MFVLRYYATFKVNTFESLFSKINTRWQKTTTCIGLQAKQISLNILLYMCIYLSIYLSIYMYIINVCIYIYSILGMAFSAPILYYIQKLQLLVIKKFWNNFDCIVLLFVWAQKVCPRFLKSYFKLEMLIFLSFVASSLVVMFE